MNSFSMIFANIFSWKPQVTLSVLLSGLCQVFVRPLSGPYQAVTKIEHLFRLRGFLILFLWTYFPPWWTLLAWSLRTSFLGNLMWHLWQGVHASFCITFGWLTLIWATLCWASENSHGHAEHLQKYGKFIK